MARSFKIANDANSAGILSLPESFVLDHAAVETLEDKVSRLFQSLRRRIYQYLLVVLGSPAEAEDSTQECFLRLYRYLAAGNSIQDPTFWLFRVAHNIALDRKKSGRFLHEVDPPSWDEVLQRRHDQTPNPEQGMIQRERYETVRSAIHRLTAQQQQVLFLRAEGLGYREIAEVLSLSLPAVAAHVRRGIERIKAELND
jgi:RNA polymerase sigma-70 factor (ECF subfamily)